VGQTEPASADPQFQFSLADHTHPHVRPPSTDYVDGHKPLEDVDLMESIHHSRNVEQVKSGYCEPSLDHDKSVRQAQYALQMGRHHSPTASEDQVEPFHQSKTVDQMDVPQQPQSVDLRGEVDLHSQIQNVEEEDSVDSTTSSTHPAAPVESPGTTRSLGSSMSMIQICSVAGVAFVGIVAALYILRRARHSKA